MSKKIAIAGAGVAGLVAGKLAHDFAKKARLRQSNLEIYSECHQYCEMSGPAIHSMPNPDFELGIGA